MDTTGWIILSIAAFLIGPEIFGIVRRHPLALWINCKATTACSLPACPMFGSCLTEAEAQSRKREILMAYPAATVRIEKTDESDKRK